MILKEKLAQAVKEMIENKDNKSVWDYFNFDRSDLTELEELELDKKLFMESWHELHEELASSFQTSAHPTTAKFLFERVMSGAIPEFDYKPCSRKCVWALADIGTEEAKGYLEEIARSPNEYLREFATRRIKRWEIERGRKGRFIRDVTFRNTGIRLNTYADFQAGLPPSGRHIVAYQTVDELIVYQAYKPAIVEYAVAHQKLGGPGFSYKRMSWIKPNFLWMMYRSGWATKENQERILAIRINKKDWEDILSEAVFSSFQPDVYDSNTAWKAQLQSSDVRLQWDPAHDPYGNRMPRKAIQIGMRGRVLEHFGTNMIKGVYDITKFVARQKLYVDRGQLPFLEVPAETCYTTSNDTLKRVIGL